ncbi:hypothetical protein SAMD00024442_31_8 [Candidatus Symbiothrix dinenymphae]|nr:hypothetical protein SAMD00024442_31_8 [Candidatus Symbiothrix dinenymphae]
MSIIRKLFTLGDKAFMPDWLSYQPYDTPADVDFYYLKLCGKVHAILRNLHFADYADSIDAKRDIIRLSCSLVAYFQDVISETKVFAAFTERHKKLYGSYLPFYKLDDSYYADEINLYDLYFLVWHHLSMLNRDEIIDPLLCADEKEVDAINDIYALLNEEFEYAPQNERLQLFLQLDDTATIFDIRKRIEYLASSSFLNYMIFDQIIGERAIAYSKAKDLSVEQFERYMYDTRVEYIFNRRAPLLALRYNEILADIIGESHPLYETIRTISERKYGVFLFKEQQEKGDIFQHVHSKTIVALAREERTFKPETLVPDKFAQLMGIVKMGDLWYQMGVAITVDNSEKVGLIDIGAHSFDAIEPKYELLKTMEQAFKQATGGKLLSFAGSDEEYRDFHYRVNEIQCRIVQPKVPEEDLQKHLADLKAKLKPVFGKETKSIAMFFNPKRGLEIYFNIPETIRDSDNPFYNPTEKCPFNQLMTKTDFSKEFIDYLMENQLVEFENTPTRFVVDMPTMLRNADFLLRYYRSDEYWAKPKVTITNH